MRAAIESRDVRATPFWTAAGLLLATLASVTSSCGSDASCTLRAAAYDQSCGAAADCVGVHEGDLCGGGCDCVNAAINVSAQQQFAKDASSRKGNLTACPARMYLSSVSAGLAA